MILFRCTLLCILFRIYWLRDNKEPAKAFCILCLHPHATICSYEDPEKSVSFLNFPRTSFITLQEYNQG